MTEEHPNVAVLKRFNPTKLAETIDVFAEDVIWHYFNPGLPELHGDYIGHDGIQTFFEKLRQLADSEFKINTVSVNPIGDELVVVHRKQIMNLKENHIESDVVVVWRIVDKKISEVWDIPSIHAAHITTVK